MSSISSSRTTSAISSPCSSLELILVNTARNDQLHWCRNRTPRWKTGVQGRPSLHEEHGETPFLLVLLEPTFWEPRMCSACKSYVTVSVPMRSISPKSARIIRGVSQDLRNPHEAGDPFPACSSCQASPSTPISPPILLTSHLPTDIDQLTGECNLCQTTITLYQKPLCSGGS